MTACEKLENFVQGKKFFSKNFHFHKRCKNKIHNNNEKNVSQNNDNSQAVGWDSWVLSTLKSILRGDPIFDSAAWFFGIILKFILIPIFEMQIYEKKISWHQKNSFTKADLKG